MGYCVLGLDAGDEILVTVAPSATPTVVRVKCMKARRGHSRTGFSAPDHVHYLRAKLAEPAADAEPEAATDAA